MPVAPPPGRGEPGSPAHGGPKLHQRAERLPAPPRDALRNAGAELAVGLPTLFAGPSAPVDDVVFDTAISPGSVRPERAGVSAEGSSWRSLWPSTALASERGPLRQRRGILRASGKGRRQRGTGEVPHRQEPQHGAMGPGTHSGWFAPLPNSARFCTRMNSRIAAKSRSLSRPPRLRNGCWPASASETSISRDARSEK